MPFEELPGVQFQTHPSQYPQGPAPIPRDNAAIINAVTRPLLEAMKYWSPEERKNRDFEQLQQKYKATLINRQLGLLSGNANGAVDPSYIYGSDGMPVRKKTKIEMDEEGLDIAGKRLRNQATQRALDTPAKPGPDTNDNSGYWGKPPVEKKAIPVVPWRPADDTSDEVSSSDSFSAIPDLQYA